MNDIIEKMDWDYPEDIQVKAREEASKIKDLSVLILNEAGKGVWENCALVLADKTDEELYPYLDEILVCFQDLTWPGTQIILKRLLKFDENMLKPKLEETIYKAYKNKEFWWIVLLDSLLKNPKLKQIIDSKCLAIIEDSKRQEEKEN